MQAASARAWKKPIKQSALQTGTMRTCLPVYRAMLSMIGVLQRWYGSLPVCVYAANFVTAKWSAINNTSVPDRMVRSIHSPRYWTDYYGLFSCLAFWLVSLSIIINNECSFNLERVWVCLFAVEKVLIIHYKDTDSKPWALRGICALQITPPAQVHIDYWGYAFNWI